MRGEMRVDEYEAGAKEKKGNCHSALNDQDYYYIMNHDYYHIMNHVKHNLPKMLKKGVGDREVSMPEDLELGMLALQVRLRPADELFEHIQGHGGGLLQKGRCLVRRDLGSLLGQFVGSFLFTALLESTIFEGADAMQNGMPRLQVELLSAFAEVGLPDSLQSLVQGLFKEHVTR